MYFPGTFVNKRKLQLWYSPFFVPGLRYLGSMPISGDGTSQYGKITGDPIFEPEFWLFICPAEF